MTHHWDLYEHIAHCLNARMQTLALIADHDDQRSAIDIVGIHRRCRYSRSNDTPPLCLALFEHL